MTKVSLDQVRLLSGDLHRLLHRLRAEEQILADTERCMKRLSTTEDLTEDLRQKRIRFDETLSQLDRAIRLLDEIEWDYRETEQRILIASLFRGVRLLEPIVIQLSGVDVSDMPLIERGG